MTSNDTELIWGAYLRLSRLKGKRRKGQRHVGRLRNPDESVERQRALVKAYAAEHGLNLPEHLIFVDNGRSAWKRGGKRDGWNRMLKAGKAGEFGGLLTWKIDRFTRNVRDGEDLIDLGLLVDGPESRRIDLRTAHGMSVFRKQVEAAAHASNETSEKVRAAFTDMIANGYRVSAAGRQFGFQVLSEAELDEEAWADEDGRFTGPAAVVVEEEAEIIRELARRLLARESLTDLAADLNRRGILNTRGNPWSVQTLSRTLGHPIYGGWLAYQGEVVGRLANTEPILDADTYEAVQDKLGARKSGRRAGGNYPLTGLLVCGNPDCPSGGTMAGAHQGNGKRAYVCARVKGGCGMTAGADPVEALVRDRVVTELADADAREAARRADATQDAERAKLRDLLADLDGDMADTEAKLARIPVSQARRRQQLQRNLASMEARHAATERQLTDLGPVSAPAPALAPITGEQWEKDTPAARKAAIVRHLGLTVTILPKTGKPARHGFDRARVVIDPPAG